MAVLTESPWYQQILKEGEARGRQEEMLSGIELGLEIKFGTEGLQLMPEISQISDLNRLKAIQRGILTSNTLEEFWQLIF
jgi:predicted transposase YdaD